MNLSNKNCDVKNKIPPVTKDINETLEQLTSVKKNRIPNSKRNPKTLKIRVI